MSADKEEIEKKGWMSDLVNQIEERAKNWSSDLRYQLDSSSPLRVECEANESSDAESEFMET